MNGHAIVTCFPVTIPRTDLPPKPNYKAQRRNIFGFSGFALPKAPKLSVFRVSCVFGSTKEPNSESHQPKVRPACPMVTSDIYNTGPSKNLYTSLGHDIDTCAISPNDHKCFALGNSVFKTK